MKGLAFAYDPDGYASKFIFECFFIKSEYNTRNIAQRQNYNIFQLRLSSAEVSILETRRSSDSRSLRSIQDHDARPILSIRNENASIRTRYIANIIR
jgi:hypothetical protein